jgi:hypothetical protein
VYDVANTMVEVFSVPTSEFLRHETFVSVPWFWKRYFFGQKHLPKPAGILAEAEDYDSNTKKSNKVKA